MSAPQPDPAEPEANLEPAAMAYVGFCPEAVSMLSIAISLKRIADVLDGTAASLCVTETIFGRKP